MGKLGIAVIDHEIEPKDAAESWIHCGQINITGKNSYGG